MEVVKLIDGVTQSVIKMTELFEMMLPTSLESDQFMLEEMCGGEFKHTDWSEFLSIPQVGIWSEAQTYSRVKAKARKAQSNMDVTNSQNAKTIMSIVEKREGEDVRRVVLTRIPEKEYGDS
jgi:hypothetical protein